MILEIIILSEVIKTEKDKSTYHLHVKSKIGYELTCKTETELWTYRTYLQFTKGGMGEGRSGRLGLVEVSFYV